MNAAAMPDKFSVFDNYVALPPSGHVEPKRVENDLPVAVKAIRSGGLEGLR